MNPEVEPNTTTSHGPEYVEWLPPENRLLVVGSLGSLEDKLGCEAAAEIEKEGLHHKVQAARVRRINAAFRR